MALDPASTLPRTDPRRRVLDAAEALVTGRPDRAHRTLEPLLKPPLEETGPAERLAHVFALGLLARMQGVAAGGNLYAARDAPPGEDMLAAFEVLYERTPFVRFGHEVAAERLAEEAADEARVHLLDLGMGTGIQWRHFLDELAQRAGREPPEVHLTGVDLPGPSADPEGRLRAAGRALGEHAQRLGVPFRFDAIAISLEHLDPARVAADPDHPLFVNAAFALHHILPSDQVDVPPGESRDDLLTRLHGLKPQLLTLVEPDANHSAPPFPERVAEALRHYGAAFDALDALLPRDLPERDVIERAFFGREIVNVVSAEGAARTERHEPLHAWRERMRVVGFEETDVRSRGSGMPSPRPPGRVEPDGPALRLRWAGVPLVASSAWQVGRESGARC